jgi:hypothetical protein
MFLLVMAGISYKAELPVAASLFQIQAGNAKAIILDRDGKRLRGATVTFENGGIKREFKSNRVGELAIDLPIGVYTVSVERYGLKITLPRVEVATGLILTIPFPFKPSQSQTYSESVHLNGKVKGHVLNFSCEPAPDIRATFKSKGWEQIITPDQNGDFIVDVPDGDYMISIFTVAKPGHIKRPKNGELYLFVDTGIYCDGCSCGEDDVDDGIRLILLSL